MRPSILCGMIAALGLAMQPVVAAAQDVMRSRTIPGPGSGPLELPMIQPQRPLQSPSGVAEAGSPSTTTNSAKKIDCEPNEYYGKPGHDGENKLICHPPRD